MVIELEKRLTIPFIFLIIFSLTGCAFRSPQLYDGPRMPRTQVSVLLWGERQETSMGYYIIRVDKVNGRVLPPKENSIELLPGEYQISVSCSFAEYSGLKYFSANVQIITLNAGPGHFYKIRGWTSWLPPRSWNARIDDITENLDEY